MIAPPVISTAPLPLRSMRFELLLEAGLAACQRLAGERWTDYNEHDPGVTILEQLCYAMTDIGYRIDYPMPDLLAGAPGPATARRHTLYPGDAMLSCQALAPSDYRLMLYDAIQGLKNAWLEERKQAPGRYQIWLEPAHGLDKAAIDTLVAKVAKCYHAHRNLGEDLDRVELLELIPLQVGAVLDISASADPATVVAEVLFQVQEMLSPHVEFESVDGMLQHGVDPDRIFDGPLLEHGALAASRLQSRRWKMRRGEVLQAILKVPEVNTAEQLVLWREQGDQLEPCSEETLIAPRGHLFCLDRYAAADSDFTLKVLRKGEPVKVDPKQVERLLAQRRAALSSANRLSQRREAQLAYRALAPGRYRAPGNYFSIQHQFPATYGIGRYGIPDQPWLDGAADCANPAQQRQAQARQLKAYLLFFEQILANQFAQLEHAGSLFGTGTRLGGTYFAGSLAHDEARDGDPPDIRPLLLPTPVQPASPASGRQVVQLYGRLRRGPNDVGTPGRIMLHSGPLDDEVLARQHAAAMLEAGCNSAAYHVAPGRGGSGCIVTLRRGGATLALDPRPHPSPRAARMAIRAMAAWLCHLRRAPAARQRFLRIQPRGTHRLELDGPDGQLLLQLNGLSAAAAGALAAEVLEFGQRPARYVLPRPCGSTFLLLLDGGAGPASVEFSAPGARSADAAGWQARRDQLIAWCGRLACDATLRRRHLRSSVPPAAGAADPGLATFHAGVAALVRKFDPAIERRHQFLDHLLARFGERFDDATLARLDPRGARGKDAFRAELLDWKIAFLRQLAPGRRSNLGARRYAACDYTRGSLKSRSGMEQRLRLLAGIGGGPAPRPAACYAGEDLVLLEHVLLRPRVCVQHRWTDVHRLSLVLPAKPKRCANLEFRAFFAALAADNCPAHLAIDCHWLAPDQMQRFSSLHVAWRTALALAQRPGTNKKKMMALRDTDSAADALHRFMQDLGKEGGDLR